MMKFPKLMKSLDRKFGKLRKKSAFLNKCYNHLSDINVEHSFHSAKYKAEIKQAAAQAVQQLLAPTKQTSDSKQSNDSPVLPKIIWMYWHSGFDNAPEVTQLAVQSWQKMNPDYEVRLLNNVNIAEYVDADFDMAFRNTSVRCLLPIKADILRLYLLSRYGGVWVDATTFCMTPLNDWLPQALAPCGIFNFKQKNNPTRPIEVWFIAVPAGSPVINDILTQYLEYLNKPRELTLFISGKVPLLNKVLTEEEQHRPLGAEISERAEKFGFMPYFSMGYFSFEAIKRHLSESQVAMYLRQDEPNAMTNLYALTKDPFSEFENAYVSKQTYIESYLKSNLFQQRKAVLMKRMQQVESRS
ncbi:capsular polysaccharide synthesis protein [Vibrio zhugei]|uniref:Capsular polysaccharide synthesis protein n=1 Tax=Vibrio zhugei TaxID=2479546 RepID=A0ABV7CCN0_9VIBR|nr:capsular polysaccharide synthesis protein [Vibrio zhugei]